MRFDMSVGGMRSTTQQAQSKGGELDGDGKMVSSAVDQAAGACGDNALGQALAGLSGDVHQTMRSLSSRVQDLVSGSNQAVGAYDEGDQEMGRNANQNQARGNFSAARFSGNEGGQ